MTDPQVLLGVADAGDKLKMQITGESTRAEPGRDSHGSIQETEHSSEVAEAYHVASMLASAGEWIQGAPACTWPW
jgi:hypothetical protein